VINKPVDVRRHSRDFGFFLAGSAFSISRYTSFLAIARVTFWNFARQGDAGGFQGIGSGR
jgi:hypothetical protein